MSALTRLPTLLLSAWLGLLLMNAAPGAEALPEEDPSTPTMTDRATSFLWSELSQALIKETGVAISPVIGLSYLALTRDSSVEKFQPYLWIVIVLMVAVILKDTGGPFVPGLLKKPLDALEFLQNQGLAVFCLSLLVPELHAKLFAVVDHHFPAAEWAGGGQPPFFLAATALENFVHILTLPLSMAIFAAVWLLSNTINALILLSPFSLVDTALKSIKAAALAALAALTALHPYLGAAFSCLLILLAFYLSGWALRLYRYAWILVTDLLLQRHCDFDPPNTHVQAFLNQTHSGVPSRTYGKLSAARNGQGFSFTYHLWLIGPRRTVNVDLTKNVQALNRGLIHPSIQSTDEKGKCRSFWVFPPRYRGHEDRLASQLGLKVDDAALPEGCQPTIP